MSNSTFDFKQFSVRQDRCAMKVGTDGVLLGAWCEVPQAALADAPASYSPLRILDVGAGTGLISLMLAQRYPSALIEAVEIDPEAAAQCRENFLASPWADRLEVHAVGLQQFTTDVRYDLIVSNPPFYNATLKPSDAARASARHFDSLPTSVIMGFACRCLSPTGSLALIFPKEYEASLMTEYAMSGLALTRSCDVVTRQGKPAKRRMVQFSAAPSPLAHSTLALRDADGLYSPDYLRLTADFYIHLH